MTNHPNRSKQTFRLTTKNTENGPEIAIRAGGHTQHIWHTSYIEVSETTAQKVREALGEEPYFPVDNCCGRAMSVYLRIAD